ncbi:hypothetical protein [Flavobacterium sp.]|uniref:hypothetical protein n=1 Tax=Flavobacterium sp. TaxID=239 RepID=UPI003750AEB9
MNLENLKIADISLQECLSKIKNLASQENCFIDEIPEILKEDFNNFIFGHTLSTLNNRQITYDMKMYYDKLNKNGIDYSVKWNM